MAKPVLKLKLKRPEGALDCPRCDGWLQYQIQSDTTGCVKCDYRQAEEALAYPRDWIKGQLLNLRRTGEGYVLTLLNEEFDPQQPERSMHFGNSYEAQEFISYWYNRETSDPRAT